MIIIEANIKTKGISYEILLKISLMMLIITKYVSDHTIFSDIAIFIFSCISICFMIVRKKVYFSEYYFILICFIAYHLILVLFNISINSTSSLKMISTLIVNFLLLTFIYNYIFHLNNIDLFFKIYVHAALISFVLIVIFLEGDIFSGRLGHSWRQYVSYYIIGQPVYLSANATSNFCSIGFLISTFLYNKEKRKKYLIFDLIFILGVLLSGSRKGILILCIYSIYMIIHIYRKKALKLISLLIIAPIFIYFIIIKIPLFYENIGLRVQDLIISLTSGNMVDASTETRFNLIDTAKEYISYKPLFGYGLGSFKYLQDSLGIDNNYYELLMSGGLVGFLIYYSYIVLASIKYMKLVYSHNNEYVKLLYVILMSFLLLDIGTVTYSSFYFQFWIAAYFSICSILKKNKKLSLL